MDFFVSRIMQQAADPGFSAEEYFDYGPGLYGETDMENARGVLKEASIDTDGLQMEMYEALDERWLRFVIGNRTGYAEQDAAELGYDKVNFAIMHGWVKSPNEEVFK